MAIVRSRDLLMVALIAGILSLGLFVRCTPKQEPVAALPSAVTFEQLVAAAGMTPADMPERKDPLTGMRERSCEFRGGTGEGDRAGFGIGERDDGVAADFQTSWNPTGGLHAVERAVLRVAIGEARWPAFEAWLEAPFAVGDDAWKAGDGTRRLVLRGIKVAHRVDEAVSVVSVYPEAPRG